MGKYAFRGLLCLIGVGLKGVRMITKGAFKTLRYAMPVRVMTLREVSAYLQVHPSTIYRMLKHNQIPAFHVGSDWRFNIETIDNWCLEQEKHGA